MRTLLEYRPKRIKPHASTVTPSAKTTISHILRILMYLALGMSAPALAQSNCTGSTSIDATNKLADDSWAFSSKLTCSKSLSATVSVSVDNPYQMSGWVRVALWGAPGQPPYDRTVGIPDGQAHFETTITVSSDKGWVDGYLAVQVRAGRPCNIFFDCAPIIATWSVTSVAIDCQCATPKCSLQALSGDSQEGGPLQQLSPLVVRAKSDSGAPASATVDFAILQSPTGTAKPPVITPASTTTTSDGLATASVTLGDALGVYTIQATSPTCSGNVKFTLQAICTTKATAALFDPVGTAGAIAGDQVTGNISLLKSASLRPVSGVAADGVARSVIRIQGCPRTTYAAYLLDENGNDPNDYRNTVGDLASPGSASFQGKLGNITTDKDGFAAVVYRAPSDFPRGPQDSDAQSRSVTLRIARAGIVETSPSITIVRPPVVLVHGLWDTAQSWSTGYFSHSTRQPMWFVDYGDTVTFTGSTPKYYLPFHAIGSALGIAYGSRKMVAVMTTAIDDYKRSQNLAASAVDVIAHSMGGLVSRAARTQPGYYGVANYQAGLIHKLITIGTPHLGSALADTLLDPANGCIMSLFAAQNMHAFETVQGVPGVSTGAVEDLRGWPNEASNAIKQLERFEQSAPALMTAMLAGNADDSKIAGIDKWLSGSDKIRKICGIPFLTYSPGKQLLRSSTLPGLLGGHSDGIVPLVSAGQGQFPLSSLTFNAVHSNGATALGFLGPHLMELTTVIDTVMQLLNTPLTDTREYAPIR